MQSAPDSVAFEQALEVRLARSVHTNEHAVSRARLDHGDPRLPQLPVDFGYEIDLGSDVALEVVEVAERRRDQPLLQRVEQAPVDESKMPRLADDGRLPGRDHATGVQPEILAQASDDEVRDGADLAHDRAQVVTGMLRVMPPNQLGVLEDAGDVERQRDTMLAARGCDRSQVSQRHRVPPRRVVAQLDEHQIDVGAGLQLGAEADEVDPPAKQLLSLSVEDRRVRQRDRFEPRLGEIVQRGVEQHVLQDHLAGCTTGLKEQALGQTPRRGEYGVLEPEERRHLLRGQARRFGVLESARQPVQTFPNERVVEVRPRVAQQVEAHVGGVDPERIERGGCRGRGGGSRRDRLARSGIDHRPDVGRGEALAKELAQTRHQQSGLAVAGTVEVDRALDRPIFLFVLVIVATPSQDLPQLGGVALQPGVAFDIAVAVGPLEESPRQAQIEDLGAFGGQRPYHLGHRVLRASRGHRGQVVLLIHEVPPRHPEGQDDVLKNIVTVGEKDPVPPEHAAVLDRSDDHIDVVDDLLLVAPGQDHRQDGLVGLGIALSILDGAARARLPKLLDHVPQPFGATPLQRERADVFEGLKHAHRRRQPPQALLERGVSGLGQVEVTKLHARVAAVLGQGFQDHRSGRGISGVRGGQREPAVPEDVAIPPTLGTDEQLGPQVEEHRVC